MRRTLADMLSPIWSAPEPFRSVVQLDYKTDWSEMKDVVDRGVVDRGRSRVSRGAKRSGRLGGMVLRLRFAILAVWGALQAAGQTEMAELARQAIASDPQVEPDTLFRLQMAAEDWRAASATLARIPGSAD